jgi:hypothetical protein
MPTAHHYGEQQIRLVRRDGVGHAQPDGAELRSQRLQSPA